MVSDYRTPSRRAVACMPKRGGEKRWMEEPAKDCGVCAIFFAMFCEYLKCARVNVLTCQRVFMCVCVPCYKLQLTRQSNPWCPTIGWHERHGVVLGAPWVSARGFHCSDAIIHDEGLRFTVYPSLCERKRAHRSAMCCGGGCRCAPRAQLPFYTDRGPT